MKFRTTKFLMELLQVSRIEKAAEKLKKIKNKKW